MRILYFHQSFTTLDGWNGTRSYEFARALLARGHEVTMVCGCSQGGGIRLPWDERHGWSRGLVDGIDVIALPMGYTNRDNLARRVWVFLQFAWRSIRIALKTECDLLYATSTPLTAALPGIAIKFMGRRTPFIFEVRDLWPELPRALGMKNPLLLGGMSMLEWLGYRCADGCVGLSPGIVDGIRKRAPIGRQVSFVPNGCDLGLFSPDKRVALDLPGIVPGDFVAGFTGAHGIANGLDALLDAAAVLKRRGRNDIKFVLIGDGNQKAKLMKRANDEALSNCLFFPPMKKTQIACVTASLDCGLQILADVPAFYYGTSPNKFFDYASAGIPIVNNYPGWLAEEISASQCGVAVPSRNPHALAAALVELADNRDARETMGRNARRLAITKYNRDVLARQWVELVESHGSNLG